MIIFDGAIRIWAVRSKRRINAEIIEGRTQRAQRSVFRSEFGLDIQLLRKAAARLSHSKRAISEDGPYNSKRRIPHGIGQFVGRGSALACSASCLETRFWAAIKSKIRLRRVLAASGYFRGEYLPGDPIMPTRRADSLRLRSLACLCVNVKAPDSIPKVSLPKYASFR